jgi:hypothetical protein
MGFRITDRGLMAKLAKLCLALMLMAAPLAQRAAAAWTRRRWSEASTGCSSAT